MIGFLIGCIIGGTVGITAACLCVAAAQADREINRTNSER